MKKIFVASALLVCIFLLSACSAQKQPTQLDEITLPVGFIPNVQFAPLYVAIENGYFADENIEITLDHNMEQDTVALVGLGKIPFGICSGEQVLLGRDKQLPIVYVLNWYQQYPVAVVSLAESNILTMQDLRGKRISIPMLSGANYIGLEAMLQVSGLRDEDLILESVGYAQTELLTLKKTDAAVVYINNDPVQLLALGYEINLIAASDLAPLVGNGLVSNAETIQNNPQLVERMTRAILRGIAWTAENPDAAFEISKKHVDGLVDVKNQDLQKKVLEASIALYRSEPNRGLGVSSSDAWENMNNVLIKIGLISSDSDVANAYTNQFVENVPPK